MRPLRLNWLRFALLSLFTLLAACSPRSEKHISGTVYDCDTLQPVDAAVVTTLQSGWGISQGQLVWDKGYTTTAQSDVRGRFTIAYKVGDAAKLHVSKPGYHTAEQFETADSVQVRIGLLRSDGAPDFTHNCRLIAECLSCRMEEGVEVCRDTCLDDETAH